jgi:hypothetical protein
LCEIADHTGQPQEATGNAGGASIAVPVDEIDRLAIRCGHDSNRSHNRREGMSKKAAELISKLSTDASFRERFRANPDSVMDAEGLSAEDKEVLKSGDPDKIRQHLGDDSPPGCFLIFV